MSANIGRLLDRMQSLVLHPEPDDYMNLSDKQTDRLFELASIINAVKEFHSNTIKEAKSFFDNNLKILNKFNFEGTLRERKIKSYRRKLHKLWKDVENADYEVMKSTNLFLDLMKIIEMYLADKKEESYLFGKIGAVDLWPMDNMGFSKQDGYSENPSGKISFLFQAQVFNLVGSILNLHKSITLFLFCQADIINIFKSDSKKGKVILIEYISKMFPEELKRKKCFEIIKDELEEEGINYYSEKYILKQLSNWNVYNPSEKDKNKKQKRTKPLIGYENAKKSSEENFREWVRSVYIPYYKTRKTTNSISSRRNDPFDDNNEKHTQQPSSEDFYDIVEERLKEK